MWVGGGATGVWFRVASPARGHIPQSGIYLIVNSVDSSFYVGGSTQLRRRLNRHFQNLQRGVHTNAKLQAAFDKWGPEAFSAEIIETCESDVILQREQFYIDTLNPTYNLSRIAGKVEFTDAIRLKISKALTGKTIPYETRVKLSIACKKAMAEKYANVN